MDEESLAALADGTPATVVQKRHLARCRICAGSYAEAVRARVRDLAATPAGAPAPAGAATPSAPFAYPDAASRRRPRPRLVLGLMALAVLALVAPRLWRTSEPSVPPEQIQSLLEEGSARSLVLPGGEGVDPELVVTYRGTDPLTGPDIDRRLLAWSRSLRAGDATQAEVVWLVGGLVSQGRLDDAAVVLRLGQARWPRDRDLAVLDAVLAWKSRRDLRAETLLRQVLDEDSGHSVARYNLGWILQDLGRDDEAVDHLRWVTREQNGRPLGTRAAALVRTLERN